jgi:hypothetical protein
MLDGSPLTGAFMIGRADTLCRRAGVQIFDSDANIVSVGAASWRAGYVLSARHANIPDSTICVNGRWRSLPGPGPYSFESTQSLGNAAVAITDRMYRGGPPASFAGGRFLSDNVLLHGAYMAPPGRRP